MTPPPPPNPPRASKRRADHCRQQRDVHLHLVLAHRGGRPLRPRQHRVLHRRHRREHHRSRRPWFILGVMLFSYAVRSSISKAVRCSCAAVSIASSRKRWAASSPNSPSPLSCSIISSPARPAASPAGQYMMGLAVQALKLIFPQFHEQLGVSDTLEDEIKRGAASSSPSSSRCISSAKICSACTNRATRPSRS